MSELEEILNKKAALIQSNQVLSEYIDVEIIKKSLGNITADEYRKTSHYKDSKFIPAPFKENGYTKEDAESMSYDDFLKTKVESGLSEDSNKKSENESNDPVKEKESENVEQKKESSNQKRNVSAESSTGKSQAEDNSEFVSDVTDTARTQIQIPEVTSTRSPEAVDPIAKITFSGKLSPAQMKNHFFSGIKQFLTPVKGDPYYRIEYGTIDASNPRQFKESFLRMAVKMMEEGKYMFSNVPHEEEPIFRNTDATPYDMAGWNILEAVRALQVPQRVRAAKSFLKLVSDESLASDDDKRRIRVKRFFAGTAAEKAYQETSDDISRRRLVSPKELHALLRNFADMDNRIEPIQPFDELLTYFYAPDTLFAFGPWASNNFRFRTVMWDFFQHIVQTEVTIVLNAVDITFNEISQVLSTSSVVKRKVHDYAAKLSQAAAKKALNFWFTAKLASRWSLLWIDINHNDTSLEQLMDCIMAKLFLAADEIHPDCLLDIDNYIAGKLIPAMPTYQREKDPYNQIGAEERVNNYLTLQFRNNTVSNIAIREFLGTTRNGNGWANAGQSDAVAVPASAVKYLNPRKAWYMPAMGKRLAGRRDTPLQFIRFMSFVNEFKSKILRISAAHDNIGESFRKLCMYAVERRTDFTEFIFFAQRFQRMYSLNALTYPKFGDELPDFELDTVVLPRSGLFSAIAFMNFDGREKISAPINLLHTSWIIHEDFNAMVGFYNMAKKYLDDDVFSRKDWVKFAFDAAPDSTGFIGLLRTKLITDNELLSTNMPDETFVNQEFRDRQTLVENFIKDNHLSFNYVNKFFYVPDAIRDSEGVFQRVLSGSANPLRTVTYKQVQDMLANESYAHMLETSRIRGQPVCFDFPVNFITKEVSEWKNEGSIVQFPTESTVLTFKPIIYNFTTNDIVINDTRQDLTEFRHTTWIIADSPYIQSDESFIQKAISTIEVDKTELELITDFKFISVQ
jgi:hypothetical protein